MQRASVLLIGHGSREERANAELRAIADAYRAARPHLHVEVAFVEIARPLVSDALAELAREGHRVAVVPLFLFAAGHAKNDLPLAIDEARRRWPAATIALAPALGVHPVMIDLAYARVAPLLGADAATRARTLLLVVGRGSSDADANGDFCKVARMIGEGRGLFHVETCFAGITEPSVATSLALVARMRPDRVVVLPYLLFAGRLVERLERQVANFAAAHPWIRGSIAPHLGAGEGLLHLVDERASGALRGDGVSPCDACQYRTESIAAARQVGGLRALLFSVRHALTHGQATPPVHLHRPLKKHVLVCGNADCVDRGSVAVLEGIRSAVKDTGRAREIKITRTSCMGRCGEGPTVAVYPDGVFYQRVAPFDAHEIVTEHLVADRLVSRLVGDILH